MSHRCSTMPQLIALRVHLVDPVDVQRVHELHVDVPLEDLVLLGRGVGRLGGVEILRLPWDSAVARLPGWPGWSRGVDGRRGLGGLQAPCQGASWTELIVPDLVAWESSPGCALTQKKAAQTPRA